MQFLLSIPFLFLFTTAFSPAPEASMEKEVWTLANKFRSSQGKKTLEWNDELSRIARQHSEAMAKGTVPFSHQGFEARGNEARKLLDREYSAVSENVAYGNISTEQIVDGWKKSKGHRENMLGEFSYTGVGIARAKDGVYYYTQIFVQ